MIALRIFYIFSAVFVSTVIGIIFYLSSDLQKERWLVDQIQTDLRVNLLKTPDLVDSESYGWAEEGGDKLLVKLSPEDCSIVAQAMTDRRQMVRDDFSTSLIEKNNIKTALVNFWYSSNKHQDIVEYDLVTNSCILNSWHHYE